MLAVTAFGIVFFTASAVNAQQEEKVLNFYNWSDYIAPDTIANFEKETGIKVNYDVFDSSEILHAKLMAGRTGYDVVMSSSGWARMQADGGLLRPLDKSLLPNLKNLDPLLQSQIAKVDPDNKFMVTWLWGYITVGINVDLVKRTLGSTPMPDDAWDLIFNPSYAAKLKSCGVSFLDSPSEVIPAALHYLHLPLNTTKQADYDAVSTMLAAVRPYVTLISSTGYMSNLEDGSLCVSMGWSGDLNRAQRQATMMVNKQNIKPLMPKSGGVMFFDTMVIPKDAPHVKNAHIFMNYIMRPEVHAALTNKLLYANPNLPGRKFVTPSIANNPTIFPSEAEILAMDVQGKVSPFLLRMGSRTFTKFKSGL
ncbi:extracellular solute-binding protein [Sapientia aquatica]|uniref:Putrescine-binding periplasmic protein n=2 Tax=Sapientia aquatica TaxID=1549640 RepID=A0A4R5VN46_9BURK|nr:extracellular solute-binding protein [Sapientia aquatica]